MNVLWKTWRYHEQQPTTFVKEKGTQPVHPASTYTRPPHLAPYKRTRMKSEECTERNGEEKWMDSHI